MDEGVPSSSCSDPIHLEAGKIHTIKQKKKMDTLICQHCHRCAFCAPLYDSCWHNSHLPNVHWKAMLDRMIKMPGVEDYLKNAGHDVKQVKMARGAYLKHFCKRGISLLSRIRKESFQISVRFTVTEYFHQFLSFF